MAKNKRDLIIVGGGAAGLSAAACASETGASVLVLETNPRCGGNALFAEVLFGLNTQAQHAAGKSSDLDQWFLASMEHSHWKNNARLVRAMQSATGETVDWLCNHGLKLAGFEDEACTTHFSDGKHTGLEAIKVLQAFCDAQPNIEIRTGTTVKSILQDSAGGVLGVTAESKGIETSYEGDHVLITCGGFSGNANLASEIIPGIDTTAFAHIRGIRMQGHGIQLARKAGAEILTDGCFENAGPTFSGDQRIMAVVTKRYALWLNARGRRFANEAIGDNFVYGCNAVYAQPGHFCYVLLDADMLTRAINGPVDFLAGPDAVAKGTAGITEAIQAEANNGRVCYTDSLNELANWMQVDYDSLREELKNYNQFCQDGKDSVFLKPAELLQPITKAPYLAIRCGVDQILSHGGIRVDENLQVLRADGTVIQGLYAAGADISGTDTNGYQTFMGGHSLGFSLTGGRIAAAHACQKENN